MTIYFSLAGQIPSGKNAVVVTRSGHRFPNKRFKAWREEATRQVREQVIYLALPLRSKPLAMRVTYTPGDLRTRDVSGMLDALFHLLTHADLIEDDGQIRHVEWNELGLNRAEPRTVVTLVTPTEGLHALPLSDVRASQKRAATPARAAHE